MLNSEDKVAHLTFLRSPLMSLLFHLGVRLPGEFVVVGVRDDSFVCSPALVTLPSLVWMEHPPTHCQCLSEPPCGDCALVMALLCFCSKQPNISRSVY